MNKNKGVFITFEGNDGSGKDTQADLLVKYCKENKIPIFLTNEPGGSKIGKKIRKIIIKEKKLDPVAEFLLFAANRKQNLEQITKPKTAKGINVVSVRCLESSMAYQGAGKGVDTNIINNVHKFIFDDFLPDLTIILLINVVDGLQRSRSHGKNETAVGELDRFEKEDLEFHNRMHAFYKKIGKSGGRFVLVEITKEETPEQVFAKILASIREKLPNFTS